MKENVKKTTIEDVIRDVAADARKHMTSDGEPPLSGRIKWPVSCTVGPGLEGAIACETRIGYVNGSKGELIYRGYSIFDLCEHCSFEEVSYLLLNGHLPTESQLTAYKKRFVECRYLPNTLRMLMNVPIEGMHPMAALRLGVDLMRRRLTWRDALVGKPRPDEAIAADEDSIPMETLPTGEPHAIYEFKRRREARPEGVRPVMDDAASKSACIHLVSGLATITAAVARVREDKLPIEPDADLGHAANFLYMMTGRKPTPEEERIMDIVLILHADHGMNASTFASMVVASTMADIYFSIGSGIGALHGPLHGGANEQVVRVLEEIGRASNVHNWVREAVAEGRKIPGFGHRVYKTYDPRARILGPLARQLTSDDKAFKNLYRTACKLESVVDASFGREKKIFPNVDFYSGLVYSAMGIPVEMFTPIFAVSRVAGWTARVHEYLGNNRIFRPRAWYTGEFDKAYVPIAERNGK